MSTGSSWRRWIAVGALAPAAVAVAQEPSATELEPLRPELSLEAPSPVKAPVTPAPKVAPAETRLRAMASERSEATEAMLSLALAVAAPDPGMVEDALAEVSRFSTSDWSGSVRPVPALQTQGVKTPEVLTQVRVPLGDGALRAFGPTRSLMWPGLP